MHQHYNVRFNPAKIIDHFGGVSGALKALELVGVTSKTKTLQKQRERGNMPADVVASLILASVKMKKPINIIDCLLVRTKE